MGVALLYAYRAQSPSTPSVPISQAVAEINGGQVKTVTLNGDQATIDKVDGTHEVTVVGQDTGGAFQKVILDYNAANPSRQVTLNLQKESQTFGLIGSVL